MPVTPTFFQFEADFVESLRCIPMQVRYKLDTCGVKLKLHHWHQLEDEERQGLVEMPCATIEQIADYRRHLRQWVRDSHGGDSQRPGPGPGPSLVGGAGSRDSAGEGAIA